MSDQNSIAEMSEYMQQWHSVQSRIRSVIGGSAYRNWIEPLQFYDMSDQIITLSSPSQYLCEWVNTQYGKRIREIWLLENNSLRDIKIIYHDPDKAIEDENVSERLVTPLASPVLTQHQPTPLQHDAPTTPSLGSLSPENYTSNHMVPTSNSQNIIGSHIKPSMNFTSFVAGKSNELALSCCQQLQEGNAQFNPLFLYGASGTGKTHLLHAIANQYAKTAPHQKVIIVTADQFIYYFVRSLQQKEAIAFKEELRCADILLVDDVQFLTSKPNILMEFYHTINSLLDRSKQLVITCDRSAHDIEGLDDRVRSRFAGGVMVEVSPPDYDLRLQIVKSKAQQAKWKISQDIAEFLAQRITTSVREIEGAVNRLVAYSCMYKRNLTLEECQDNLQDMLSMSKKRITIEEIQRTVAEHYGIQKADMQSAKKHRDVVRPRQIAMYLAKQMTSRSLPEIGRKFGGRDHSTIIYGIRRVETMRGDDQLMHQEIEHIRRIIEE